MEDHMMHLVLFSAIGFQRNPDYKEWRIESKLLNTFINDNYTMRSYDADEHRKMMMKILNKTKTNCNIQAKLTSDRQT